MAVRIEKGDRVTLRYQVYSEASLVDSSPNPITIVIGEGRFLKPVEEALVGKEEGEKVTVWVAPEDHHGRYDPKKLKLIPAEKLPPQARVGETVLVQDEWGVLHPAKLRRRDASLAVVDLNHPLAGKYLRFEIEILKVEREGAEDIGGEA